MPQFRCRTGFAQKTKSSRFVTEIFFADDLQCHGAMQIDIERFVSDSHCTATQLDWIPVTAPQQFIMLKALSRLSRCRLDHILERRPARRNPTGKTLAEHAYRAKFHRSRKLIAAGRTGALGLRAHGPKRALAPI